MKTRFVKTRFVKTRFVKTRFVKTRFVKERFIKPFHELMKGKPGGLPGLPILAPLSCSVLPLCSPLPWDRCVPMLFARLLQ